MTLSIGVHAVGKGGEIALILGRLLGEPAVGALRRLVQSHPAVVLKVGRRPGIALLAPILGGAPARLTVEFEDQVTVALHLNIAVAEKQSFVILRVNVPNSEIVPQYLDAT